jgi:hypothetical protein
MLFSCYVGGALLTMVMEISIHAGVANWVFIGLIVFWCGAPPWSCTPSPHIPVPVPDPLSLSMCSRSLCRRLPRLHVSVCPRFGFVGVGLPLTVVEASVSGLFVAFAEAPATISYCHPLIYHRCAGLFRNARVPVPTTPTPRRRDWCAHPMGPTPSGCACE